MCPSEALREFISCRLTAAAVEIFTVFEQTIVQYEEEIDRQRRLLETHTHDLLWRDQSPGEEGPAPTSKDREEPRNLEVHPLLLTETKAEAESEKILSSVCSSAPHLKQDGQELQGSSRWSFSDQDVKEDFRWHFEEKPCSSKSSTNEAPPISRPRDVHKQEEEESLRWEVNCRLKRVMETRSVTCEGSPVGEGLDEPLSPKTHSEIQAEEKPYSCDTHGQSFHQYGHVSEQEGVHDGVKPHGWPGSEVQFHCERPHARQTCGKRFFVEGKLKVHRRRHGGPRPYSCEICGKSLANPDTLKFHMRTHTGEKPYACEVCGKRFPARRDLKRHMTTHTGERPYSCEICGKGFGRQQALNVHMRVHTGEKPYSCHICGKCFTQNINLKTHTKTHREERL